jgi:transketolase
VEHVASLRAIPGLTVIRPADANETVAAWRTTIAHEEGPVALILTRQKLPILAQADATGVARGGYVLDDAPAPQVILVASGSEVSVALEAKELLAGEGIAARVVSMPSWELFEAQPQAYRDEVLPSGVGARVTVEAGVPLGWDRYAGPQGAIIGMGRFGASAPYQRLAQEFGFTAENVAAQAKACLK